MIFDVAGPISIINFGFVLQLKELREKGPDLGLVCDGGDKGKGGIELAIIDASLAFLF